MAKSVFSSVRKKFDLFESRREVIIKEGRSVLKDSKAAIYALHRGDVEGAKGLLVSARSVVRRLGALRDKDPHLETVGALHEALEEFAEASLYYRFVVDRKLASPSELGVGVHVYLPAVCDLVGELVRKAMNDVIRGDHDSALRIRSFVSSLYDELLLFDWRNTPVRRKFDSLKYSLEKLDDLVLQLRLKEV